ncbi:SDR family oxidoreductase [Amycolatopsis sp. K13G38]|uniref:SDR family oxidoreductase n=1 Tax=Amycolatopsis acididurans TaxID=2724524 RepID=A0ABX1IWK5_9PSEU|nr:SDR family oxidoreductase [Amycolatopsis acididurans]NKQ51872.1 SDR family oxidoreductase [Amycolatopsis acididurans]
MSGPLSGRTAVVTGGGTGIGRAIADRLLADGARVLTADLAEDGDLSAPDVAETLRDKAIGTFGAVDVLVNNAGGGVIRPTLEHTEQTLRATIDNNLWTTLRCCLAFLPHMRSRRYGRIVNIGAESVRNGLTDHAVYNAAKGGVHGLTTGLAREFATDGITVNVVAPSYTLTPELARALDDGTVPPRLHTVVEDATALIPMARPARVGEIAAAVAYLATDAASFVTGQVLSVNGGSSMC